MRILKKVCLLIFMFLITTSVNAATSVDFKSTISGITNNAVNTYTYEITPDSSNASGASGEPTSISITFDEIDVVNNRATGTGKVDFSNTTYTRYGIYKYVLKENSSSNVNTYPLDDVEYIIQLEYSSTGINVLQSGISSKTNLKEDMNFNHTASLTYLTITSKVQGEMADQDKNVYFKYRLHIEGNPGDVYTILGMDSSITYDGKTISTPTTYVVSECPPCDSNYLDIYLRHDQEVTIGLTSSGLGEMGIDVKYSLTKQGARGWKTYINERLTSTTNDLYTSVDPIINIVNVVNERDFDVPITGLFVDILPFIILVVLGIVLIIVFKKVNKDKDEDSK